MENQKIQYGSTFQNKLILALISDKNFALNILDLLNEKYFTSNANAYLYSLIKRYYLKYKRAPNFEEIKIEIKDLENKDKLLELEVKRKLSEIQELLNLNEDLNSVKDLAERFCLEQNLKNALRISSEILDLNSNLDNDESSDSKYNTVIGILKNAILSFQRKPLAVGLKENYENVFEGIERKPIPTPWPLINEISGGGLAAGELGILAGTSGGGKTWGLVAIGVEAMKRGYKVLHYTLELTESYVKARYISNLTEIKKEDFKLKKNEIIEKLQSTPGDVFVEWYSTKSLTTDNIRSMIEKRIINNEKPDLIIIDYADLLKPNNFKLVKNVLTWETIHEIYEDLRNIAGEYNIPIWTASQTNRDARNASIPDADSLAGAYSKNMIADLTIAFSRRILEKLIGTAKFYVIKNRMGPDGQIYYAYFDTEIGKITMYDSEHPEAIKIKIKMGETKKKIKSELLNKLEETKIEQEKNQLEQLKNNFLKNFEE